MSLAVHAGYKTDILSMYCVLLILCCSEREYVLPILNGNRHIPDVRARTSHLFLALNKRGDFKIWSDEFEELCDVIAKEVERPPEPQRRISKSDMLFVNHPVYSYIIWAFTLGSLAAAITQLNVNVQTNLSNQ